jgi:hypothetical protein
MIAVSASSRASGTVAGAGTFASGSDSLRFVAISLELVFAIDLARFFNKEVY